MVTNRWSSVRERPSHILVFLRQTNATNSSRARQSSEYNPPHLPTLQVDLCSTELNQSEERAREGSHPHPSNRSTHPATAPPHAQSRSGTTTPDALSVQTPTTTAPSNCVPTEVREYMHARTVPCPSPVIYIVVLQTVLLIVGWQQYYNDALAQAKSPNADVVLLGSQSAGRGQKGGNNLGSKPSGRGPNPWGTQNRIYSHSPPPSLPPSLGLVHPLALF